MRERDQPEPLLRRSSGRSIAESEGSRGVSGFVGRVEYRHVYSRSGGEQHGIGPMPAEDLLVVYAEAFERDADPADFSLDAIVAHECGHQRLIRNGNLQAILVRFPGQARFEEVLASLVGSLLLAIQISTDSVLEGDSRVERPGHRACEPRFASSNACSDS